MSKTKKLIFVSLALLLLPLTVKAETFWQKQIPVNTGAFVDIGESFSAFTVNLPVGVEVFAQSETDPAWIKVERDIDDDDSSVSNFYFVHGEVAKKLRLRAEGAAPPAFLEVSFYNTTDEANPVYLAGVSPSRLVGNLKIISRTEWGADESFRFKDENTNGGDDDVSDKEAGDANANERAKECGILKNIHPEEFEIAYSKNTEGGKTLKWPYQYSQRIFKVVIHHTAENGVSNGRDPKEVLRGIYSYHTLSRGWGDIGYHFIIDPYGNIYEGRAGGDYVIGGHVYCNNIGTIGVSLMGNFQEVEPTAEQITALGKLLPQLAALYELDLTATENFHGKSLPNLVGHRQVGATACPGENMFKLLPDILKALANSAEIKLARSFLYSAEIAEKITIMKMAVGDKKTLQLKFKNTGNVVWNRDTWLYVFQPKTGGVSIRPAIAGRSYVAAKLKESGVPPGGVGTFNVELATDYRGGLFTLEFTPVVNGKKVTSGAVIQPVEVETPTWGAKIEKITFSPETIFPDKRVSVSAQIKNTGNVAWYKDHITLSVVSGGNHQRIEVAPAANVAPGQIGEFNFSLDPFVQAGAKILVMNLLVSGERMPRAPVFNKIITVENSKISAQSLQDNKIITYIKTGKTAALNLKFKNTGNVAWSKGEIFLNIYKKNGNEKVNFNETVVAPGATATFSVSFLADKEANSRLILMPATARKNLGSSVIWFIIAKNSFSAEVPRTIGVASVLPTSTSSTSQSPVSQVSTAENIRIKLSFPEVAAQVSAVGGATIFGDGQKIATLNAGSSANIVPQSAKVSFSGKSYSIIRVEPFSADTILQLDNWSRSPAWDTSGKINDNRFRGALEFRVYNGAFTAINELDLENYLLGMAEVSTDTHFEKMKAMAILIRTYARFYLDPKNEKFPGAPYDGSDSPAEFQKYLGQSFAERSGRWAEAVQATKDLVVVYQGALVKTPYFNQSDGRTRSALEVWGWQNTPYLVSVPDPFCEGLTLKGHGVGLSGVGAQKMAEQGKTYEQIIKYYYRDVSIEKNSSLSLQ